MKKVISIVGARPQFIKAAIVSKTLRDCGLKEILVHTGQHYDVNMSDVFFDELNLPKPDYYLGIGSGTHGYQTGRMLMEIEKVLMRELPDLVIVYGDTNTTLAGALASVKLHIQLAHVEAGLRSFNKRMPEEINRVLTDHISDYLFAPTATAVENLKREGIKNGVYWVGDVMFDLATQVARIVDEKSVLEKFRVIPKQYILVTIHRAENTDDARNLSEIVEALNELSEIYSVIFPIHPRTLKMVNKFNLSFSKHVKVIEPVSYKEMIALEKNARLIITDSGGVQREAYFFKVPCVIPRNETEWVELVDSGWHKLVGPDKSKIVSAVLDVLKRESQLEWINFFGEGDAAIKIAKIISQNYYR